MQINIRNGQVDNAIVKQKFEDKDGNYKKYKVKAICNSIFYTKKSESDYLLWMYNMVLLKDNSEEKNIWKPALAI